MDSSIPGIPNSPLSTPAVFADNVQDLLNAGALNVKPTGIIAVNSIDDVLGQTGVTTLRDAINQANADPGEDLIVFDRSLFSTAQTITLKLGELDITHSLDIIAPRDTLTGGDLVTVSANKASRVFEIEKGATVTFNGLIVADGSVTDNGAGIKNLGSLTIDDTVVRNNIVGRLLGGGIYNEGTLTVNNSTISSNNSISTIFAEGGGIYNLGKLSVYNSTITGNSAYRGGGIANGSDATIIISHTTLKDNWGQPEGGGIYNNGIGIFKVCDSTISGNRTLLSGRTGGISYGAGIDNVNSKAILLVSNSIINNNSTFTIATPPASGGGIYNAGTLEVDNSTITANSAQLGGGIYNKGITRVNNSTIIGNSTIGFDRNGNRGGGIYNDYSGTLTLLFSTVTKNTASNGGGVYQNDVPTSSTAVRGSISVRNTIIAANTNKPGGVNPDVSGKFNSNGYNLIGDGRGSTGFGVTGDIVGTSAYPINPRLGVLAFNGGRTQTIALLPGSPAINAGDPTVLPTDPKTDQRGKRRVQNGRADIGAFESSLKK